MNLETTINKLARMQESSRWTITPDLFEAIKLGIEALKRLYLQREHPKRKLNHLLPGETKD